MLASAGVEIKFNHCPNDGFQMVHPTKTQNQIQCISWSAADKNISFVPQYGNVEIINVKNVEAIEVVRTITVPEATVCCFPKTSTKRVAIGGSNGKLILFDTGDERNSTDCKYALSKINFVDFNSDDQCVAVAGNSENITLYSSVDGQIMSQFPASKTSYIGAMRFHPEERNLRASTNESGYVMIWDINTIKWVFRTRVQPSSCIGGLELAFNHDFLVTTGGDRNFCVYNWNINECIFKGNVDEALSAVDLSNDGLILAIGGESGNIYLYDIRYLLQPVANWMPHLSRINTIRFQHKVNLVDSCTQPETIKTKRKRNETNSSRTQTVREELEATPPEPTQELEMMEATPPKSQATLNEKKQMEIVTLPVVKAQVLDSLRETFDDIEEQTMKQLAIMQKFFEQEMRTLEMQMDSKWDNFNFAGSAEKDKKMEEDPKLLKGDKLNKLLDEKFQQNK